VDFKIPEPAISPPSLRYGEALCFARSIAARSARRAVARFLALLAKNQRKRVVRAGGLEPPRDCSQRIFLPSTVFTAAIIGVCGLDYPFTLALL